MQDNQTFKKIAALAAVEFVRSGMILGLGTGSTFRYVLERIAELYHGGKLKNWVGVPSSLRTEQMAKELALPLTTLAEQPQLDLTIDGADEVDPALNAIKGGGGALWREKMLAQASKRFIIVVDESKLVPVLGSTFAVPVEVSPFGWRPEALFLESIAEQVTLRSSADGTVYSTDQGNYILDCRFGPIADVAALARTLDGRAGVAAHGLFLGLATDVIAAGSGGIQHRKRND